MEVEITSPEPGALVTTPLTVSGRAKGGWFFEGSLPVKLLDPSGHVLAEAPGQAQGEWMTSDWVTFEATLTFAVPATTTGTLVISKDNPSDLPEKDAEFRVSVRLR